LSAVVTKAVVARAVVELPAVWVTAIVPVGRLGVPVKVGEARGALRFKTVLRSVWSERVPVIAPHATPPPPETVAHLSSVPSKDRTWLVVGAVAFKVVAAALVRDEMESFGESSESTEALL